MNNKSILLRQAYDVFLQATETPGETQTNLLLNLIKRNSATDYGRRYSFDKIRSAADYQSAVPVVTYDLIREHVDKIESGEGNPLFADECIFLAKTSGTTGRPKLIPFPAGIRDEYWSFISPMMHALEVQVPGALEQGFCLSGKCYEELSPGGIPVGQSSGFVRRLYLDYPYFAGAPEEVFEEVHHELRYFLLAAFALTRPLKVICSLNPSTLLTLFKTIEKFQAALARGFRSKRLVEGPDGFEKLAKEFSSRNLEWELVAERIENCRTPEGRLQVTKLWPELKVVQTWQGGSARHYLESLREYCPGSTLWPMVSGSSEAALLVPLSAEHTGGVPALGSTFFEYVEEDADPARGPYLGVCDLKKDGCYRTIVTNSRGLYRLAMEDVFTVTGFHGKSPVMSFLHRVGNTSSLTGEKLAEKDVTFALKAAQDSTGVAVTAFQVAPEWGNPPRYILLAELRGAPGEKDLKQFAAAFERGLWQANTEYEAKRQSGRLAPLLLCCIEAGELERLKAAKAKASGRSDIQLKIPMLTRDLVDLSQIHIRSRIASM